MRKHLLKTKTFLFIIVVALSVADLAQAQWQAEWERVLAAARKEGKLVLNIPPGADLRKALEENVKAKFGIEVEIVLAHSATTVKRVGDEYNAGVRYFDVITSTWDSLSYSLLPAGAIELSSSSGFFPRSKSRKTGGVGTYGRTEPRNLHIHPMRT